MRFSMPVRDLFMILSSFMAMIAGAFLPQLAEPLAFLPRICLMLLLYLGFLSVGTEALFAQARIMPGRILEFVVLRLAILPLFAFAVFQVLMPSFALGALLVAASCVGVVAPVFSNMVRANTPFILVSCLVTSLLLPASLPALLYVVDTGMQILHIGKLPLPPDLTLSGMTVSLCITIIIPFVAAFVTRNQLPKATVFILRNQFPAALITNSLSTLSVFSQYAEVLHQDPSLVLHALGAALLLGLLMMIAGMGLPRSMPGKQRLAFLIGFGTMNNVLILILSMQFFAVNEALIAALYLIPLNGLLLVYRACSRRWELEA